MTSMLRNALINNSFRPVSAPGSSFTARLHTKSTANVFSASRRTLVQSIRPNIIATPGSNAFNIIRPLRFSRGISTDTVVHPSQRDAWRRFGITAAVVAGTVVGVEAIFNRPTRDSLSEAERSYLNDSFKYTGGGLAITATAAMAMFKNGFAFRVMSANPWVVLGVSLVGSIGSMMGVYYTSPDNPIQKHIFWLVYPVLQFTLDYENDALPQGFNACQAAVLSPLFFLNPAVLSRAALYTCGVVGSLSYIGATATNDKYLYMGGPLLAGVTVVALSSIAPLALPLGMRSLALVEAVSLYGGLAVFGGFVLYDTQKILHHARLAATGAVPRDPMRESIALELDFINIFIRLVQILGMRQGNRNK
ncbi:hypothetical protein BD410DRAFT_893382 [Rickenella mellea]|uniref:Bax inhibitor family protein n=1 Tax=Rickenella mellea TaxID=50990 RepID=A0A4Y7QN98_9AGAM|nr:hypothetical protein BD410DRAFT_893382 [Rickenella mellea]